MLVRPLKLTNQFRGMMPTLSGSDSLMHVTPTTATNCYQHQPHAFFSHPGKKRDVAMNVVSAYFHYCMTKFFSSSVSQYLMLLISNLAQAVIISYYYINYIGSYRVIFLKGNIQSYLSSVSLSSCLCECVLLPKL